MDAAEKRKVETELLKMGLAGLDANDEETSELVQQIAGIVNAWQPAPNRHGEWIDRHKFLRDLFGECEASERSAMYDSIVPYLNFKALPLPAYETMITERMSRLISKGAAMVEGKAPAPVEVGGKKYVEAPANAATHALITIQCQRCGKKKNFLADTPAGAMIMARKRGWQRIFAGKGITAKETCPKCVARFMKMVPEIVH